MRWPALAAMVVLALGCVPRVDDPQPREASVALAPTGGAAVAPEPVVARLPQPPSSYRPAFSETVGSGTLDGAALARSDEECALCHADVAAQWRTSAHAFASFDNPIYRVSVEAFREANDGVTSRFCAGCHDPALLLDGAMDGPVSPDDHRAHTGVTCLSCHRIDRVTRDGNGSWRMVTDSLVTPTLGDEVSTRVHKQQMNLGPLRQAELCGSCHRAFLGEGSGHDHHLVGTDDYGAWQRSAHAGSLLDRVDEPLARRGCIDCHMPEEDAPRGDVAARDGRVRSHRFIGGHTWLASMRGDTDQLARVQRFLRTAASISVSALRVGALVRIPADGAALAAGERVDVEVVVRNMGTGHRFPGGTLDAHDVWIDLQVVDAAGDVLATAGRGHGEADQRFIADPSAHLFRATVLDHTGQPVMARRVHQFRAQGYDNTLAARDRVVVPYALRVPDEVALPLTIRARLLHRSREPLLHAATCDEAQSRRGGSWTRARQARSARPLDVCAPQPVTILAEHRVRAGGAPLTSPSPIDDARLLIDHGSAWSRALVEHTDAARPSLEAAIAKLSGTQGRTARRLEAAAHHGLANVAARQGRIHEMQQRLAAAEVLVPGQPAYAWTRGKGLASVWRNADAVRWLRVAASGAPDDDRGWVALAVAQGSVARHHQALTAAHQALVLMPRQPDALRVQALALRGLRVADPLTRQALEAFLTHRRRDDGPRLRSRCSASVAGCGRERTPVHRHILIPRVAR